MQTIFLISDSPEATTGLARLTRGLLTMLPEYRWVIWSTHHDSFLTKKNKVFPVFDKTKYNGNYEILSPAQFGVEDNYSIMPQIIENIKPDFIITAVDFDRLASILPEIKRLKLSLGFKWINYFPADRTFYHKSEIQMYNYPDANIGYAKNGIEMMDSIGYKGERGAIYLPVDLEEFPEVDPEEVAKFRKELLEIKPSTYLVGTVNRAFFRKDPAKLLFIYSKFAKKYENSMLYMHSSPTTYEGDDLRTAAYTAGIQDNQLKFPAPSFNEVGGVTVEKMNLIYRMMDLFVTISMGEGFGYTAVEAMACGIPVIAPKNTTFPELVQDFGLLLDTDDIVYSYKNNQSYWPTVNYQKVVDAMIEVKRNKELYKEKVSGARKWVSENLSYDVIRQQWKEILVKDNEDDSTI